MNVRVIPRLDIKGPNLVKGIQLEGLRVLGRPDEFARHYYEQGADELLYVDIVASLYQRNRLEDVIARTAEEIFIPLTVGGGLRSLEDIRAVLRCGADKVAINTAAIREPALILEASEQFGSSTIVVSIEAKRRGGAFEAYTDNGRERTGRDAVEWACEAASLGAGEILLTSIDREGGGAGFDIELTRRVAERVEIPVIACGGAGQLEHARDVVVEGRADAIGVASMLHYGLLRTRGCEEPRPPVGVRTATLRDLKEFLAASGIECRPSGAGVRVDEESYADCGTR